MTVRHFLTDLDLSPVELDQVLTLAGHMKANPYAIKALAGPQTAAVFFDKTSTRTRFSFVAGISALGGAPLVVNPGESQLGHKETIADTARVLDRMVSLIIWRTYAQSGLEEMAQHSAVPVINALSDDYHPCQLLADLLTLREHLGTTQGRSLAYLGDAANNMANSYLLAGVNAGMDVRIAGPEGFLPEQHIIDAAQARAAQTGGKVLITTDPVQALDGADAVATDTWVSMGQEEEKQQRLQLFGDYRVDAAAMAHAAPGAVVLHCLPAYRGVEISAEVIDGPQSVVWDEAENRLHAQKALMAWLLVRSGLADEQTAELVRAGER
ncbi:MULTISPECIES: ornithine carbamoyltransferase [unclassified Nesterenkonia]|uniref:ornithine carbamoyltransferase n=1 Tax=unclassified Nesterenkonia TaxID=2629769 RepID=UPI001F4C86F2|nr:MULTISPECIES: ornithine carbamoyltransferase [unclassified Nesterenkonia]MCH8561481.1 ornithine carbamoyltransferase [Nesterenkonia sp. DZ6]MCH8563926.1 ornithine carbamoyltransferase [Nesterenkonia sp. YGD6]